MEVYVNACCTLNFHSHSVSMKTQKRLMCSVPDLYVVIINKQEISVSNVVCLFLQVCVIESAVQKV